MVRARAGEPPVHPLLDRRIDGRWSPRAALAAVTTETGEEALSPAPAVEILDSLRHRLEAPLSLAGRQLESGRQPLDDTLDVPGVHEAHRENLGRARELESRARRASDSGPRLGLVENELLGDEVHPVAQRRNHHHVRAAVEGDERRLRDVAVDVLDGSSAARTDR